MYAVELDFGGEANDPAITSDEGMVLEWIRLSLGVREDVTFTIPTYANGAPVVRFVAPTRDALVDVVKAYAPLDDDGYDGYDQEYLLTFINPTA